MALAADHSTMPTAANTGGLTPDDEPRFVQAQDGNGRHAHGWRDQEDHR